jgi:hypothetical protein
VERLFWEKGVRRGGKKQGRPLSLVYRRILGSKMTVVEGFFLGRGGKRKGIVNGKVYEGSELGKCTGKEYGKIVRNV